MAELVLGPLLRHVGSRDATVWVETSAACEVEILRHRTRTFHVEGHHYAIVYITSLEPGSTYPYTVALNGSLVWPEQNSLFPPSTIKTPRPEGPVTIVFGSCRTCMPNEPPYTLARDDHVSGRGIDALRALVQRLAHAPSEDWPQALLLLGDQVYADDISPVMREFIRARRDPAAPPGEEVADFEEYTRLYRDAWGEPTIRWLFSTLPTAMIFDDHDVNDDWNISAAWVETQRTKPWWQERIVGAFMSYWIYQHLGNLSPAELEHDPMFRQVREVEDAGPTLREFARRADRAPETCRWSFHRDFGRTRLLMIDSRAGRVLEPGARAMLDAREWRWIEDQARGEFDHLLLGSSLPALLAPGIHYLEGWNEAVCDGAWGRWPMRWGEKIRQRLDLEHWSAFQRSFRQLFALLREIGQGTHAPAPATIVLLSGDVHHAYLIQASYPDAAGVRSRVYQAVCSPLRNTLGRRERRAICAAWSRAGALFSKAIARAAGVCVPEFHWRPMHKDPWFGNQIATLDLHGRRASIRIERPVPGPCGALQLQEIFRRQLGPA